MRFALDKDGKRVYIEQTHAKQDYFCPECGEKLVLKKGEIRMHHFAHPSHSKCTDSWHYDMSDWHMRWQARFPLETQEIVKTKDGQKHRADVLLEDKKVVCEFQHSPLSPEEFDDRNAFYNSLGYKVIWIFDLSDQYENGSIENYKSDLYKWTRPKKTFNHFVPKENPNVELYFQIQLSADENEMIQHLKSSLEAGYEIHFQDQRLYYEDHKDDEIELVKVTWAPDDGFERFATDGFVYDEKDIVHRFVESSETKEKTIALGKLADRLVEMYGRSHTTYYFGCPRSSTHLCGDSNIDTPKEKYDEVYPCVECQFSTHDNNYRPMCKKRFLDLGLSGNTRVEVLKRTEDGFVSQIAYEDGKGRHIIDLPTFNNPMSKSVFTLWKENGYKVAIFKNIKTGKFIKIKNDPTAQRHKYGKVFGYFSSDQFSFNGKNCELYGCEKPEWICVWSVK